MAGSSGAAPDFSAYGATGGAVNEVMIFMKCLNLSILTFCSKLIFFSF